MSLPYETADERLQGFEDARSRAEAEEKQRQIDYRVTFSSAEGARVLEDLLGFCSFFQTTYRRGDAGESAFTEGQRNVALYILEKLNQELRSKLLGGL